MKAVFTFLAVAIFSIAAYSQHTVTIDNTSDCDVFVKLWEVDASCASTATIWYSVTSGNSITVTSAPGTEFHGARIVNQIIAAIPPCFIFDISPTWGVCLSLPNSVTHPTCCLDNPITGEFVGTSTSPEINIF